MENQQTRQQHELVDVEQLEYICHLLAYHCPWRGNGAEKRRRGQSVFGGKRIQKALQRTQVNMMCPQIRFFLSREGCQSQWHIKQRFFLPPETWLDIIHAVPDPKFDEGTVWRVTPSLEYNWIVEAAMWCFCFSGYMWYDWCEYNMHLESLYDVCLQYQYVWYESTVVWVRIAPCSAHI